MTKKNKPQVAIIDYGMGNLFSVQQACEHVGLNCIISSDKSELMNSDAAILPGVGAFGNAIANLKKLDLIFAIKDFIQSGRFFLAICLGMQLLMSESEEFGRHKGFEVIPGTVVKFDSSNTNQRVKVPQVGWNRISLPSFKNSGAWQATPLDGITNGEFMYFVHSYYCKPQDSQVVFSLTEYGSIEYCSSILLKNIFATQFHPEKSAKNGLLIYQNWASSIKKSKGYRND